MKPVLFYIAVVMLVACAHKPPQSVSLSTIIRAQPEPEPTLLFPETAVSKPAINTAQLIKRYEAILLVEDDQDTRARVQRRITDLQMLQTERQHFSGDTLITADFGDNYQQIIENYERLLKERPDDTANDAIWYQLAKAYDYQANSAEQLKALTQLTTLFPQSPYAIESHYRMGDIYYSRADYPNAQRHYQTVIDAGNTAYQLNALYMRGWCFFKRSLYEQSLVSFSAVLDQSLADNSLTEIDASQQTLVHDTLHIMSVSFSYLNNGESVAALFDEIGARPYEPIVYQQLAELLLNREIHHAAINTYQTFLNRYPLHALAPQFHKNIIESYKKGRYFDDVRPAQDVFIQTYASTSTYWQQTDSDTREWIRTHMQDVLADMTRYHHALGQAYLKNKKWDEANAELVLASESYRLWLEFYPADEKTAETAFLLAETLYLRKQYYPAIYWYEQAAYNYPEHSYSNQAAYAAVLTYNDLNQDAESLGVSNKLLQQARIDSQKRYIQHYPASDKTAQLWLNVAHSEYELQQYDQAIESSQQGQLLVLNLSPEQNNGLLIIEANSYFAKLDYARAEVVYQRLRPLLPTALEQKQLGERIAECIYRQGEQAIAANDMATAITHFQRVGKTVPESTIVVNADYDAATYLLLSERWQDAIAALKAFQIHYPKHAFTADIPGKLIAVYEGMEDWENAAGELRKLWRHGSNKEQQRQALFLAAQYEEKAGNIDAALNDYRHYANNYPEPFDLLLETRFKLSEMYRQKQDVEKRNHWLNLLIKAEKQQSNPRSRYLAAFARTEFITPQLTQYNNVQLTLPLNKSLAAKQKAFNKVMTELQTIAALEVAEYTTYATHQQAEVYREFAKALMGADKPSGLNELELEQYDMLLEEQAYPFEEQAIALYEANASFSWQGVYDEWVKQSFTALKSLMPGRYNKEEQVAFDETHIH